MTGLAVQGAMPGSLAMSLKSSLVACLLVTAAVGLAAAPQVGSAASASWRAPRTSFGAPDLQGTWSNVTMTPLERAATYGERLVMTPAEVAQTEMRAINKVNYEN